MKRRNKNEGAGRSEPSVLIQFHRDGSYSLHFSREFLSWPREVKRAVMKEAVRAKFRNGWPKYWATEIGTERREN